MELIYDKERLTLYCGDAVAMDEIPDESIGLIITSPPYYNARDYAHWNSYLDYVRDMHEVMKECRRVLVKDGRICWNIPSTYGYGDDYYHIGLDTASALGEHFYLWPPIIWDKSATGTATTAWGSFKMATRPHIRDRHEMIFVGSKGNFKREANGKTSTISTELFTECTQSVWRFPGDGAHPWHTAPFPSELPRRCIELFSFEQDTILDPFAGSGTTLWVARMLGRKAVGVERSKEFAERAAIDLEHGRKAGKWVAKLASLGVTQEKLI